MTTRTISDVYDLFVMLSEGLALRLRFYFFHVYLRAWQNITLLQHLKQDILSVDSKV